MPENIIGPLYMIAERPTSSIPLPPDGYTEDDIRRWVNRIDWSDVGEVWKRSLFELADIRRSAHESLIPLLGSFEPRSFGSHSQGEC